MKVTNITPQLSPQAVTSTNSSTASTAFASGSTYARLLATVDTYVAFGAAPVATNAGIYLVAGVPEIFGITAGQKFATLRVGGSDGVVSCVEGKAL